MSILNRVLAFGERSVRSGLSRKEAIARLVAITLAVWGLALSGCGAHQSGSSPASEPDEEVVEQVDSSLISTIDHLISLEDREALGVLSRDLRDQVALLTFFRSSRALSLAEQWQRVESALAGEESEVLESEDGGWHGAQLLAWVQALQAWELEGAPEVARFEGLGCADHAKDPKDVQKFAECVLRNVDTSFQQADQSLSALQRASMGDLGARARAWLMRRALPLSGVEIGADEDLTLQLARAWTGLEDAGEVFVAEGALIVLRIRGVQIAYRPSSFGEAVFAQGQSHRCTWPGEEVFAFASGGAAPPGDALKAGLEALRSLYELCESVGPDYAQGRANVAIDAGVKWGAVGPVLRELLLIKRPPNLLVRDVKTGALSGLPVALEAQMRGSVCGVEAHLRRDGVVLRGGGAPMHLVSWTDKDAFTQLTKQAQQAVKRCSERATIQFVMDEESVDWGLIVRVIERMSWPQVCEEGASCMESVLIVGR